MGRWEPDARGRLEQAALELYRDQGFERTTVAEIAARAGLTERTFFRHYPDKREVLFGGGTEMGDLLSATLAAQPESAPPLAAVAAAVGAVAERLEGRREFARRRAAVIAANAELHERELSKLSSWSAALAAGLRDRGVPAAEAEVAGELGVALFHVAFRQWVGGTDERDFPDRLRATFRRSAELADESRAALS